MGSAFETDSVTIRATGWSTSINTSCLDIQILNNNLVLLLLGHALGRLSQPYFRGNRQRARSGAMICKPAV